MKIDMKYLLKHLRYVDSFASMSSSLQSLEPWHEETIVLGLTVLFVASERISKRLIFCQVILGFVDHNRSLLP